MSDSRSVDRVPISRAEYASRVIELYLDAPDTATAPRVTDWPIAGEMYDAGIAIEIVELAFHLTFLRRYLANLQRDGHSPNIRSLAYFRTVIDNLTKDDRDPGYMAYIAASYTAKRRDLHTHLESNRTDASQLHDKSSDQL
jgi:hypothetical protein